MDFLKYFVCNFWANFDDFSKFRKPVRKYSTRSRIELITIYKVGFSLYFFLIFRPFLMIFVPKFHSSMSLNTCSTFKKSSKMAKIEGNFITKFKKDSQYLKPSLVGTRVRESPGTQPRFSGIGKPGRYACNGFFG